MTRTQLEVVDVLKAMLQRLQAAEERMDATAKRQIEIEARLLADIEQKQDGSTTGETELIDALKTRIDELQSDVETARVEAARSGERLQTLLGDLVFDDKAPRDPVGVPQYIRRAEPPAMNGNVALVIDAQPDATEPPPLAAVEDDVEVLRTPRRIFVNMVLFLAILGTGAALGSVMASRAPDAPTFSSPAACSEAATLASKSASLQFAMTEQYQAISARALAGHRVTTEHVLPGDKAAADLAENSAAISKAIDACNAALDEFASSAP